MATGADGAAAFADGEAEAFVHGDRLAQLDGHRHVVAGHDHLGALGQLDRPRHIGRAEEELRPVVVEERLVPATLTRSQHVHLTLEIGVRRDTPRLAQHLPTLDLLLLRPRNNAPMLSPA